MVVRLDHLTVEIRKNPTDRSKCIVPPFVAPRRSFVDFQFPEEPDATITVTPDPFNPPNPFKPGSRKEVQANADLRSDYQVKVEWKDTGEAPGDGNGSGEVLPSRG